MVKLSYLGISEEEYKYYLDEFTKSKYFGAIKVGGECLNSDLAESIRILYDIGLLPILVHGGGKQIDKALEEKGLTSKKVGLENISGDIIKTSLKNLIDTYIEGFSKKYKEIQGNYQINKEKIDKLLREYDQEVFELCKRRFELDTDILTEKLKEILISAFLS